MTVSRLKKYLECLEEEGRGDDAVRFACSENGKEINGVAICGSYRKYIGEKVETVFIVVGELEAGD